METASERVTGGLHAASRFPGRAPLDRAVLPSETGHGKGLFQRLGHLGIAQTDAHFRHFLGHLFLHVVTGLCHAFGELGQPFPSGLSGVISPSIPEIEGKGREDGRQVRRRVIPRGNRSSRRSGFQRSAVFPPEHSDGDGIFREDPPFSSSSRTAGAKESPASGL